MVKGFIGRCSILFFALFFLFVGPVAASSLTSLSEVEFTGKGTAFVAEGIDAEQLGGAVSESASCILETGSGTRTVDYMEWFVELAAHRSNYESADSDFTRGFARGPAKKLVNECSSFYEKLQDREKPWSGNSGTRLLKMALDRSEEINPDSIFRDVRRWARKLRE